MEVGSPDKSYLRRLSWNKAIVGNKYWMYPVDDKGVEDFMPVGRGVPSAKWCGEYRGLMVCKNVAGHKGGNVKGSDASGKVVTRLQHFWCKKSSCPICFISGWSVRGAKFVSSRLAEGVRRGFGVVEHIVVSIPKANYRVFYKDFRRKVFKLLRVFGVSGCMIFHGFRIDRVRRVLVWSPHFHVLGFIRGGYDECRSCSGNPEVCGHWDKCKSCDGFEAAVRRSYGEHAHILKVLEERKTVFGSAFYQLNHSTIKIGIQRFHTVTWFGRCGCRKYKAPKSFSSVPCSVCGDEMCRAVHVGKRDIVKNVGHPAYVRSFVDDEFDESGEPNYFDVH